MGTKVSYGRAFEKQLKRVPYSIRKKVQGWIYEVVLRGIAEVSIIPGLHDELLKGNLYGRRSVRLNRSYRLIYRIVEDRVHIELVEVHKHDY